MAWTITARDRNRRARARRKAGRTILPIEVERLWCAEMLAAAGGFVDADESDKVQLAAGLQALVEFLIEEVKDGRALRVSQSARDTC